MPALQDSAEKLARKDGELQLADHIVVASQFTANTLSEAPFGLPKPHIIPYGCPTLAMPVRERKLPQQGKLRVLFVGGLSQRKGSSYLFDACEQLSGCCELTLIGRKPAAPCHPLEQGLIRHRWIESLPHEQILEQMRQHDVLVFPSLFEGFGLVITEALSQGILVITTAHTCGPDLLTNGVDGFIVPIRSSAAIAEKLEFLHRDRQALMAMQLAALATAERTTWQNYRESLAQTVRMLLK